MNVGRDALRTILLTFVAEVRFKRRTPGPVPYRRMLCTLDRSLLDSLFGRITLNFSPPTQPPPYDTNSRNLLTVWDIFLQNWRTIDTTQVELVSTVRSSPPQSFWKYFNERLSRMTAMEKLSFMEK